MRVVPFDAWWTQSPHAETEQREPALPAMPHDVQFQRGAGGSFVPQSGELLPVLHPMPRGDSRLQLRSHLLQVGVAMNGSFTDEDGVLKQRTRTALGKGKKP